MAMWKQIFWRWAGWVAGGTLLGCLIGAIVGGIHGTFFAVMLLGSLSPTTPGSGIHTENAMVGLGLGAYLGTVEGAACGAIAFCIASLLRLKSSHLLAFHQFKKTTGVAFMLCVIGSVAGALTAMAGAFLWSGLNGIAARSDVGWSYFYGCQAGFNLGLFSGALSPGAVEKVQQAVKDFFASTQRT